MVLRTFFDKTNTIVYNDYTNTGRNPIAQLFYGGSDGLNTYSRLLFHFDESRLINYYTGGTFTDLNKVKHILKLTNTSSFDKSLLNTSYDGIYNRSSSFDLIVFPVNQIWDEGVGYDYTNGSNLINGDLAVSTLPSNWFYSQSGIYWDNGGGTFSGSPSEMIIATQHFDAGNENMEVDVTDFVNGILTGNTNYGMGIAYSYAFEQTSTPQIQYVGFFTRHTQTAYEPYIETRYENYIQDDRNNFFLDKINKLYLYVNLAGNPTNLDTLPTVTVYDNYGGIFSAYTSSDVNHITKGVYSIDLLIPTNTSFSDGMLLNDVWGNILINGISRPDIKLSFELMDSWKYYNLGSSDSLPKQVAVTVSGIYANEKIKRGDIRKVIVSTRIPYTVNQTQVITGLKYRLYVTEGQNELTIVDYEQIEMTSNSNYFLIDTQSLLPNTYYVDIKVESNLEIITLSNVLNFDITSQSTWRISQ
jgi:hypothetical protein